MSYLKINGKDFSPIVSTLKVGSEVLVSDKSGRNAAGNTVIDLVNRKKKIYVGLRYTTAEEMAEFLNAVEDFVVTVEYLDPRTRVLRSVTTYIGTPEPEYYTISDRTLCKPMNLNFIEL